MNMKTITCIFLFILGITFLSLILLQMEFINGMESAAPSRTPMVMKEENVGVEVSPEQKALGTPPEARASVDTSSSASREGDDSLALLAVFQAYSRLASAVILTEGYGAYRYRVGEVLPGGHVLLAILPTRVVLDDNGTRVTLHMAFSETAHGGAGMASANHDAATQVYSDDRPRMAWQAVQMLNTLDLRPVNEQSADGYRFGEGLPEVWTEEFGVKPGDVVVSVNGYPVGEYHSDYLVWLSFKDTHQASILIRNPEGDEFTIRYPDDVRGVTLPGQGGG